MSLLLLGAGPATAGGAVSPPPPPPVVAFRASVNGTGASGSAVVNLPTRQSGDTLNAIVAVVGNGSPVANTGWTRRVNRIVGTFIALAEYTRTSDGVDNTPLGANAGGVYAYTVISVKDPVTGFNVQGSGAGDSDPITAPTVDPITAPGVLISAFMTLHDFDINIATGTALARVTIANPGGSDVTAANLRVAYESLSVDTPTGIRTATGSQDAGWAAANLVIT